MERNGVPTTQTWNTEPPPLPPRGCHQGKPPGLGLGGGAAAPRRPANAPLWPWHPRARFPWRGRIRGAWRTGLGAVGKRRIKKKPQAGGRRTTERDKGSRKGEPKREIRVGGRLGGKRGAAASREVQEGVWRAARPAEWGGRVGMVDHAARGGLLGPNTLRYRTEVPHKVGGAGRRCEETGARLSLLVLEPCCSSPFGLMWPALQTPKTGSLGLV